MNSVRRPAIPALTVSMLALPSMAECFKFPIGVWIQGEERRCRESIIHILEIDFTFQGMAHALKFRWNDEGTYIFVPEHGMVATLH